MSYVEKIIAQLAINSDFDGSGLGGWKEGATFLADGIGGEGCFSPVLSAHCSIVASALEGMQSIKKGGGPLPDERYEAAKVLSQ